MDVILHIMAGIFISIVISTMITAHLINKVTDKIWEEILKISETLREYISLFKAN